MALHTGHRKRVRDKFETGGFTQFADHEILEALLFAAVPYRDTNPLAHTLIERGGSLAGALRLPRRSRESHRHRSVCRSSFRSSPRRGAAPHRRYSRRRRTPHSAPYVPSRNKPSPGWRMTVPMRSTLTTRFTSSPPKRSIAGTTHRARSMCRISSRGRSMPARPRRCSSPRTPTVSHAPTRMKWRHPAIWHLSCILSASRSPIISSLPATSAFRSSKRPGRSRTTVLLPPS